MPFLYGQLRRLLLRADFHSVAAPVGKGTFRPKKLHVRRISLYGNQLFFSGLFYFGNRIQKPFRVGMPALIKNLPLFSRFNDFTCIHDNNLVADI